MKKNILLVVFFFAGNLLFAQKITLAEAVEMGVKNRLELKTAALHVQLAERENQKLRAQWAPQVGLSGDLRWNTQLQTSVLPIGEFGLPDVPPDAVREFAIGVPFTNVFGLTAEQKIFEAAKNTERSLNAAGVEAEQIRLTIRQVEVRQGILESYFAAIFHKERLELATRSVERSAVKVEILKTRLDNGTALQNDLDRAVLDLDNARYQLEKNRRDYELSLENLRYRTGSNTPVEPSEDMESVRQSNLASSAGSPADRPEILAEQINLRLQELNEKRERQRNLPVVSAYANFSVLQLHDQPNPFAADSWFLYSYIGVKASMPLFDGRQAKLAQGDYRLRQEISRMEISRLKADFENELANARTTLQLAEQNIEETRKNLDFARQLHQTDQFRYRQGVLLLSELKNTETTLQESEALYLQSLYDYLVAAARFRKAAASRPWN